MGEKSSARQFLVKVDGIEGFWATKQGGGVSADTTPVYDGGNTKPDIISNPAMAEDVTVTRPFDAERDWDMLTALNQQVGSYTATVSVTPTNADLVAIKPPRVYANALLKAVQEPETDAGSGDAATCGLVFAIPDYR